jgi:hypothetical protein
MIGEHCFAHSRCEFFDATGGVLCDALPHIGESMCESMPCSWHVVSKL